MNIILREVEKEDLQVFFEHQADPVASHMAAFSSKDPSDPLAFMMRWEKIMKDKSGIARTILADGLVVGYLLFFQFMDLPHIAYWIGREQWGKGIASTALAEFVKLIPQRPLYGRAAADNAGSIRVMEKCGFVRSGTDRGFARARGEEIEEVIMRLD